MASEATVRKTLASTDCAGIGYYFGDWRLGHLGQVTKLEAGVWWEVELLNCKKIRTGTALSAREVEISSLVFFGALLSATSAHYPFSVLPLIRTSLVMPATRSNHMKPKKSHTKPIAQIPDLPMLQEGQPKVQVEQEDPNLPSNNLPDPECPKQQKRRTRGQQQANVAAAAHSSANGDDVSSPTDSGTRKRGRKTETAMNGTDDDPPPKRAKGSVGDASQPSAKVKALCRRKRTLVVDPRDPLPDRPGRNVHPAKPLATTTRRTSQEVAAEREAKKRAMEEKIREGEKAKEFLALMNINEDLDDEELLTENPQRLSAAIRKRGRADLDETDSEGEYFDLDAIKGSVCSDDSGVAPAKAKGKTVS